MFTIRIPASAGNLGSGLDVIGLAVSLYLTVGLESRPGREIEIQFDGEGADSISREENLVLSTLESVARQFGKEPPGCVLRIRNEIPVKRGLGSSGAARLAGVIAADILCELGLSGTEIISEAIRREGPPDNINSQYTGGMTSSLVLEDGTTRFKQCEFPEEIDLVFVIPDFEVATKDAREVLPGSYTLADAVWNMQRVALFFEAIRDRDYGLLTHLLKDKLHQPYRARLIPGLDDILAMPPGGGLIGTVLSGSGPTVCALTVNGGETAGEKIRDIFAGHGVPSRITILKADNDGVQIER